MCHSIPNSYLGICIYIVYLRMIVVAAEVGVVAVAEAVAALVVVVDR